MLQGAAATLRRIAASAGRDFYEGETAHKLVAHAQAHEAALTLADLRDYAPEWVTPISQAYRGPHCTRFLRTGKHRGADRAWHPAAFRPGRVPSIIRKRST